MLEKYVRPILQTWAVDRIAFLLIGVDPSLITFLGCILGLLSGIFLASGYGVGGLVLMTGSGICDMLDGSIARLKGKSSDFGCALDIVSDRIVEAALVIGLFYYAGKNPIYPMIMLGSILICVTSFLVVGIFSENREEKSFHYSRGLMERGEAFFIFLLMVALPELYIWLATLFSFLVLLTAFIRLYQFYKATRLVN